MRVLAFDTAGSHGGLALLADGVVAGAVALPSPRSYAESILVALDRLLAAAGTAPADVDLVAVSLGPGSFTGVRIGMAAAQGFAMGIGKPLVGVPSLEVLAAWARIVTEEKGEAFGAVIDARRGEVYAAVYRPGDAGLLAVVPPDAVTPAAFRAFAAPGFAGATSGQPFVLCGDGVPLLASETANWPEPLKTVFPPLGPDAASLVARLGEARYRHEGAPAILEPLYIRPADARRPVHPPGPLSPAEGVDPDAGATRPEARP